MGGFRISVLLRISLTTRGWAVPIFGRHGIVLDLVQVVAEKDRRYHRELRLMQDGVAKAPIQLNSRNRPIRRCYFFPICRCRRKNSLKDLPARLGKNARHNQAAVVQPRIVQEAEERMHGPGLRIGRTINHGWNAGPGGSRRRTSGRARASHRACSSPTATIPTRRRPA